MSMGLITNHFEESDPLCTVLVDSAPTTRPLSVHSVSTVGKTPASLSIARYCKRCHLPHPHGNHRRARKLRYPCEHAVGSSEALALKKVAARASPG